MAEWIDVNTALGLNGKGELLLDGDAIGNSLYNILTCPIGTRGWRPTYGSLLPTLIYEPCDDITGNLVMLSVFKAAAQWEPRATLIQDQCYIQPLPAGNGYQVQLTYQIKETGVINSTPQLTFVR